MKKYFLDKRTLVSGKKNYLNTSNFLNLKSYIDSLFSTTTEKTNFYPSGVWQAFVNLDISLNATYPAADKIIGHFIKVESDITVSELAMSFINFMGSNGNTVAGIYNVDITTGYPTTLVAQTPSQFLNNLGQVQSIIFTSPVILPVGIYFLASNRSGSSACNGIRINVGYNSGAGTYVAVGLNQSMQNITGIIVNSITYSSTLPTTFPAGGINLNSTIVPVISLKIS